MTPAEVRVTNVYADQMAATRARVVEYVTKVWGSLDSWREADIDRFVRAVLPVITGGQAQTAALTDAYLAAFERVALGQAAQTVGIPAAVVRYEALRGVPATEVYARAGRTVWSALADGATLDQAVQRGLRRATDLAATDMQLAKTRASAYVLGSKGNVVGYRRVLKGSESCALCIVAATQRYKRAQLMPVHPGCDCGVSPIYGDRDPGQVIDPDTLSGLQDRIAERFGVDDPTGRNVADFRDLLVTHDHGELGPVLARKGDVFTGPKELPAPAQKAAETATRRRLTAADLTNAQGSEIAAAALRLSRGEITNRKYRSLVNRVRGEVLAG